MLPPIPLSSRRYINVVVRRKLFASIEAILGEMRENGIKTTTSGEIYYISQERLKKGAPTRREVISHLVSYRSRLRIEFTGVVAKQSRQQSGAYTINIL